MTDFISVEKVYGILDAAITPISRKERLPLRDALGCVLAESLYATNDVPAFNNSAMDGFAFPGSSLPAHGLARLPVEGVSYAGVPYCGEYSPRTALRVMTGAAVPEGADTVIPFEHVRETTDDAGQTWIEFPYDEVKPGANLRLKGEEMKAGSIVMPAGLVLTAEWIGMAASLGHAELLVRRIRVAVFSTGDELAAPGTPGPLGTGRIYNANSPWRKAGGLKLKTSAFFPITPKPSGAPFWISAHASTSLSRQAASAKASMTTPLKSSRNSAASSRTITSASVRGNLFLSGAWARPDLGSSRCPGIRLPLPFPQNSTCIVQSDSLPAHSAMRSAARSCRLGH